MKGRIDPDRALDVVEGARDVTEQYYAMVAAGRLTEGLAQVLVEFARAMDSLADVVELLAGELAESGEHGGD